MEIRGKAVKLGTVSPDTEVVVDLMSKLGVSLEDVQLETTRRKHGKPNEWAINILINGAVSFLSDKLYKTEKSARDALWKIGGYGEIHVHNDPDVEADNARDPDWTPYTEEQRERMRRPHVWSW